MKEALAAKALGLVFERLERRCQGGLRRAVERWIWPELWARVPGIEKFPGYTHACHSVCEDMSSTKMARTLIEFKQACREESVPRGRSRCLLKNISLSLREGQKLGVFSDSSKSAQALLECAI